MRIENVVSERYNMKIRTISGACFVAIVTAFFLLREYVDYRLFNILLCFFCAMGTFEIARALKGYIKPSVFYILVGYGILFVPLFCIIEYVAWASYGWLVSLSFAIVITAIVFELQGGFGVKNSAVAILPVVYPSLLLLTTLLLNEHVLGFVAILLTFVISPLADTFAYLVGMTYSKIKKGNVKKLCPKLSPNKTVAGAIGGLVGGMVGAILVYIIFRPQINSTVPALIFAVIGLFASAFTEIGDLFESFIKRKVGIKDMGKIMPGHGGVMDRIDGMTFASVFLFIVFLFL